MPHHAAPTLKTAILEGDEIECSTAGEIIVKSCDFEMLRTLIRAAENKRHRHHTDLFAAITGLVMLLFQELAQWASGIRPSDQPRPVFYPPSSAERARAVDRELRDHQPREILDFFSIARSRRQHNVCQNSSRRTSPVSQRHATNVIDKSRFRNHGAGRRLAARHRHPAKRT